MGRGTGLVRQTSGGVGGTLLRYWSGPPDQWWRSRYWVWSRQTSGGSGGRGTGSGPVRPVVVSEGAVRGNGLQTRGGVRTALSMPLVLVSHTSGGVGRTFAEVGRCHGVG